MTRKNGIHYYFPRCDSILFQELLSEIVGEIGLATFGGSGCVTQSSYSNYMGHSLLLLCISIFDSQFAVLRNIAQSGLFSVFFSPNASVQTDCIHRGHKLCVLSVVCNFVSIMQQTQYMYMDVQLCIMYVIMIIPYYDIHYT